MENIRKELIDRFGEYADFDYTGNGWIDMIPKKSGKGPALYDLIKKKGLKPEEIMVFGDADNDISMFHLTPNSYAKDHSGKKVREQARYECSTVSEILQELLKHKMIPETLYQDKSDCELSPI